MYYVIFSALIYVAYGVLIIFDVCKFMKTARRANAVSAVDRATVYVLVFVTVLCLGFLLDGYYSYFQRLNDGLDPKYPMVCYLYINFWLIFHFLISQNFVAYDNDFLFLGPKMLPWSDLEISRTCNAPLKRMYIYLRDTKNHKYTARTSKENGERLLEHIAKIKQNGCCEK